MKNNWQEVKLDNVCELIAGFAFKSKDFGAYPDKVVKITNIEPPFVNMTNLVGVDLSKYNRNNLAKFIVKRGDYVLAMTGATIGKLGRISNDDIAYINQRVLKFKPNDGVDKDFLFFILSESNFSQYILNHIDSESAQANISAKTIGQYEFELPPLDAQKRISAVLGSLDNKIELNNKINQNLDWEDYFSICRKIIKLEKENQNLEAQAQAIFKSWFVDFEPFKNGKFIDSELGKIPEGWRVERLGAVCECVLGGTPSRSRKEYWEGNIPWINSGKTNEFRVISPSEFISAEGLKKSATKLLPKKTTILAITGATLGQVSLLEIDACANQSVVGILENNLLPYEYIYMYVSHNIEKIISHQTGGAQQHINKDNIKNFHIILPPQCELKRYTNAVENLYSEITNLVFQSRRLSQLRDTLLPKLMSGEIDVSDVSV